MKFFIEGCNLHDLQEIYYKIDRLKSYSHVHLQHLTNKIMLVLE